uniref:Uncharacterized protein n=1 Tax=Cannabis sativa TaxID=3483 RepID=A0A803P9C4_CANSA
MVEPGPSKKPRRDDTPGPSVDSGIPSEVDEGDAEAEALKKWLREAQDGLFRGEYVEDDWDLKLDPLTDWFKHFVGPNLVAFASEMWAMYRAHLPEQCFEEPPLFLRSLEELPEEPAEEAGRWSSNRRLSRSSSIQWSPPQKSRWFTTYRSQWEVSNQTK